jgi:hypothetical protein
MFLDHDHLGVAPRPALAPDAPEAPVNSALASAGPCITMAPFNGDSRPREPFMACVDPPFPYRIPDAGLRQPPDLLALTDLKWVMSAYVGRIDIQRLLSDSAYARRCLDEARATPSELVQRLAARVLSPLI